MKYNGKFGIITLLFLLGLFFSRTTVNADQANPPYDLSGTWVLKALSVERSFCKGSLLVERECEMEIQQSGDQITMMLVCPNGIQVFEGRTSNYSIGAKSEDKLQVTVLSSKVSRDANRIKGSVVFFDKHECPEADTGWARFEATRQ